VLSNIYEDISKTTYSGGLLKSISSKIGFQIFQTSFTFFHAFFKNKYINVEVVDFHLLPETKIIFQLYLSKKTCA